MLSLATEASELLQQRRYTESRAAFLRLTNLPLFADQGYLGLGMVALRVGDPHAARWHFLHALRCNPGYAPAHAALLELDGGQPRAGHLGLTTPPPTVPRHAAAGGFGNGDALPGGDPRTPAAHAADGPPDQPAAPAGTDNLGVYEYLRTDTSLLGQHGTAALDTLPHRRRGSVLAHAGGLLTLAAVLAALVGAAATANRILATGLPVPALWAAAALVWCLAVLRVRTTVLDLSGGRLTIERGLLFRRVTQLELWRARSIERRHTPLDRLTGHGELRFTSDSPDRQVLRARGLARRHRLRTLHTTLSDLVFLLRSSPPGQGPAKPYGEAGLPVMPDPQPQVLRRAIVHTAVPVR
jgi:membrane protein YdbS with pleckstrin-like domain